MTQQVIKPRYQTKKLDGTFTKRCAVYVAVLDEDGNKTSQRRLEYVEKEMDKGWMVFFPNGSSIHIATESELKRMGYDRPSHLVDMETGDIVGVSGEFDLEQDVERKTTPTRHSNKAIVKRG